MSNACYELEYMYRDGGNYKFRGYILLDRFIQLNDLNKYMIDNLYFIPEKIGIKSLIPDVINSDDHMLHELVDVKEAICEGQLFIATDFIDRFRRASVEGWFNGY